MDRRYQVFVSSTFVDLVEERREVMQALLEFDCLPAGMELFPASNDDQWTLIKNVIEQSDYYLVIIGGRYGSITEEGLSFTEKEYDYALELEIPVMGFVPSNPEQIPVGKTDKDPAASAKLDEFREKVQRKMVKKWSNAEDLGAKVTRGLSHLIRNNPRPGWVRGDNAISPETRAEIAELKARIAQFEKMDAETANEGLMQIDKSFAHGNETTTLYVKNYFNVLGDETEPRKYTWDSIFMRLGPLLIDEAVESRLRQSFNNQIVEDIEEERGLSLGSGIGGAEITDTSWGDIIIQLRALNLIAKGTRKRGVNDRSVYWTLTRAGDDYLVSLRAQPSNISDVQ